MIKLVKVALFTLVYLAVFDFVGVAVSTFFNIAPIRGSSPPLYFAIWFVLGVFCGLLSYNFGGGIVSSGTKGDWSNRPEAKLVGWKVLGTVSVVLIGLSALFSALVWSHGSAPDSYVPDNEALSITFLGSALVAVFVAQFFFLPQSNAERRT